MSSGFVTEKEIDEQKKARQEEWERVRKPDDPEIAPEVPYDPRSLFEQLEEHRIRKQDEWDESHKLKNQIRGLDDDESDFLSTVDRLKSEEERKRIREEKQALEEYRKSQDKLLEEKEENKKKELLGQSSSTKNRPSPQGKNKQSKLLLGAVVKRQNSSSEKSDSSDKKSLDEPIAKKEKLQNTESTPTSTPINALSALGSYDSDSNSEEDG